jgi:hypothetical protein
VGLVLVEHQRQFRELAAKLHGDARQQVGRDGRDQPDAQLAAQRIAAGAGQLADVVGFPADAAGTLDNQPAGLGQRNLPRLALEQLHAEVLLELLDLCRQRRLAYVAALGRLAEMAAFGQGHQVLQVTQVHGSSDRPYLWQ